MGLLNKFKIAFAIKSPLEKQYIRERVTCLYHPDDFDFELLQQPLPPELMEKYEIRLGVECHRCGKLLYLQSHYTMSSLQYMRPCPNCGANEFMAERHDAHMFHN